MRTFFSIYENDVPGKLIWAARQVQQNTPWSGGMTYIKYRVVGNSSVSLYITEMEMPNGFRALLSDVMIITLDTIWNQ